MAHFAKASENRKLTWESGLTLLYFSVYLVTVLTLALNQPLHDTYPSLCNPPDEHSRYMVPLYICNHGTLPTGFEEELFSGDCRWTYGFYTLLPYMVQGYAMRFVDLFTDSSLALLYTARLVNVTLGFLTAYIVLLLGKRLFPDSRVKWLFCFLVTFLPESLFVHSYVNPDSMCLLSTALMLYGLVRGYQDDFSVKSRAFLSAGVILCALSYYNGYGYILGSIILFAAWFLRREGHKWHYDIKGLLQKGLPICAVVLLCISWSFIRNYILYDGDIIGLSTMDKFTQSFGIVRETYIDRGEPLTALLFESDFFHTLSLTFIACYGSMTLYAPSVVYHFYRILLAAGILSMIFLRDKKREKPQMEQRWRWILFHGVMVLCIAMPLIILIRFAYTVDYQAQGRYLLPGLIPFMYYVSRGLEKFPLWSRTPERVKNALFGCVLAGILVSLFLMVYAVAFPYYRQVSVL